jgi:hypothetical protein
LEPYHGNVTGIAILEKSTRTIARDLFVVMALANELKTLVFYWHLLA